jgi:hypothetical protein
MEKVLLYVTKWVLARGIVVLPGTRRPKRIKEWYSVDIPGNDPNRMEQVCLGKDAFFTLKEAQANALERWEEHVRLSVNTAMRAVEGLKRVRNGELQVHYEPRSKVSTVTAFATTPFENG